MTERKQHYSGLIKMAVLGAISTGAAVATVCERIVVFAPVTAAAFFWLITLTGIGVAIEELSEGKR